MASIGPIGPIGPIGSICSVGSIGSIGPVSTLHIAVIFIRMGCTVRACRAGGLGQGWDDMQACEQYQEG
ncbi:hypothetical protein [Aeromonas salmonicida]|uniref:hypothetical protein n=1 Tax=Aeromonas salmonicida TaxID=645 RepID=UPI00223F9F6C|nr:hypothetical protein [Aeromonas salmonicida]